MKKFAAIIAAGVLLVMTAASVCMANSIISNTAGTVFGYFEGFYKVNRLGAPLSKSKISYNAEVGGITGNGYYREVKYDGVELDIWCANKNFAPGTISFAPGGVIVTGKKWRLPGPLNLGMTRSAIENLLKQDDEFDQDVNAKNGMILYYGTMTCIGVKYINNRAVSLGFFVTDL